MSPRDFDRQVGVYLDGEATRAQVMAIRRALRERPELKARLATLVRLHRAQSAALTRPSRPSIGLVLGQLRAVADRAGRFLAHTCILVLVCVELDVALPRVDSQSWVNGGRPVPLMVPVSEVIASEVMGVEQTDLIADPFAEDPDTNEGISNDGVMMPTESGAMPAATSAMPVSEGESPLEG